MEDTVPEKTVHGRIRETSNDGWTPETDAALLTLYSAGYHPRKIFDEPEAALAVLITAGDRSPLEAESQLDFISSLSRKSITDRAFELECFDAEVWTAERQRALRRLRKQGIGPTRIKSNTRLVEQTLAEGNFSAKAARELAQFLSARTKESLSQASVKFRATKPRLVWTTRRKNALACAREAGLSIPDILSNPQLLEETLRKKLSPRSAARMASFLSGCTESSLGAACSAQGLVDESRSKAISDGKKAHTLDDEEFEIWRDFVLARRHLGATAVADAWNDLAREKGYTRTTMGIVRRWLKKINKAPDKASVQNTPEYKARNQEAWDNAGAEVQVKTDAKLAEEIEAQLKRAREILSKKRKPASIRCIDCEVDLPATEEFFGKRLNPKVLRCSLHARIAWIQTQRLRRKDPSASLPGIEEAKLQRLAELREQELSQLRDARDKHLSRYPNCKCFTCSACGEDWPDKVKYLESKRKSRPRSECKKVCRECSIRRNAVLSESRRLKRDGKWTLASAIRIRRLYNTLFPQVKKKKCKSCGKFFHMTGVFFKRPKGSDNCTVCVPE